MDDSHGFRMPHARCLRYWQPATKPTKLLELRRIIPANSLPRLGPAAASMRTDAAANNMSVANIYSSHVLSGRHP